MEFYKEIEAIDLTPIQMKLEAAHKYNAIDSKQIIILYRAFLHLKKLYPNETLLPSKEVDEAWHIHILHTKKYHKDCLNIFGHYMHHQPILSKEDGIEIKSKTIITYQLIKKHFPDLI